MATDQGSEQEEMKLRLGDILVRKRYRNREDELLAHSIADGIMPI